MCGRFAEFASPGGIASHYGLSSGVPAFIGYNIAPSAQILVIREKDNQRGATLMRWGLIPHWAKDEKIGSRLINARSETVFEKPAFRAAIKKRRCLIPSSGFYEWKTVDHEKIPYFAVPERQELFSLAGIWESWSKNDSETIESCTILTTEANSVMQAVHDRMPVIIAPGDYDTWLSVSSAGEEVIELMISFPAKGMRVFPVSKAVNKAGNDSPDCVRPVAGEPRAT